MTKIKKSIIIFLVFLMPVSLTFQSCEKVQEIIDLLDYIAEMAGWWKDTEDMDNIPEDITPFEEEESDGPPVVPATVVSLEHLFPPIGDQGQYGTCVVWAVGYAHKTALDALEKGWNQTQLASASNQASPQDLWWTIPSAKRGSRCGGTNFEPAFDAMITFGVKSLAAEPYPLKNVNCTKTTGGDPSNKLANYRKIASETQGLDVENFKGYLRAGRPISIGAQLGDRFMRWDSDAVIDNDTYNNPGMQHAYHAMVLVGFDDSKGTKGAFRVRNSWGPSWGDRGSIWVDYDFFCGKDGKKFCFAAFVAQNPVSISAGGNPTTLTGADLLAFDADDFEYNDPNKFYNRMFDYEVFNSGTETIYPSQRWTITYMIYNANNAKEFHIILDDYYTDECEPLDEDDDPWGYLEDCGLHDRGLIHGFWSNITVEPGEWLEYQFPYVMPNVKDGNYYLVLMVDSYDVIKEVNEDNNFFFITAEGGKPLIIRNNKITNKPNRNRSMVRNSVEKLPAKFSNTPHQTTVVPGNLNSYTPAEIQTMLIHHKNSGLLEAKRKAFHLENSVEKKFEKRRKQ